MFGSLVTAAFITALSELHTSVVAPYSQDIPFAVTGQVIAANAHTALTRFYWLADERFRVGVSCTNGTHVDVGAVVCARGHIGHERNGWTKAYANGFDILGHAPLPEPDDVTSDRLSDPQLFGRKVRLTARVIDQTVDEIDPRYEQLVLRDRQGFFSVSFRTCSDLDGLVGARVRLAGITRGPTGGKRKFFTPGVILTQPSDLTVLEPAPKNPYDVPAVGDIGYTSVNTIQEMGRRKAEGLVLAAWGCRHLLLRTDNGQTVRADLARKAKLPGYGTRVQAAGFPSTDLFNVNLTRAAFRIVTPATPSVQHPQPVKASAILAGEHGAHQIQPQFHGQLVRLRGRLLTDPVVTSDAASLELHCENYKVAVNADVCPQDIRALRPESILDVTGVCVLNTGNWQVGDNIPHIDGITLVLRWPSDLQIVSHPPWWTVGRLLVVIGALLTALVVILVWNRLLQRLIRRRGHELARMELAKAIADLRIDERTRLAVDIHDSLSQTLTGVSLQIDAAEKTVGTDDMAARGFLAVARKTLASCREELRRCLWDLRNNTIGEPNFGKAIERMLKPHAKNVPIAIRFNVPRSTLTDSTAHDILSIVRELTVNAIRHGKPSHVRIAGEKREGIIRFSVTDDGVGFNPEKRPGVEEGHFGLQGVRERLNRHEGGTLRIESTPGKGTRVIVELGK